MSRRLYALDQFSVPIAQSTERARPKRRVVVLPRSRGGADTWENLVWTSKDVNARKGNRLPHEAGLKLFTVLRAPKELSVTAHLRNAHDVAEWKLFLNE